MIKAIELAGAEEDVGGGQAGGKVADFADEKQRGATLRAMVDVPLTRCGFGRGVALGLPVEQLGRDEVVLVHRVGEYSSAVWANCI